MHIMLGWSLTNIHTVDELKKKLITIIGKIRLYFLYRINYFSVLIIHYTL